MAVKYTKLIHSKAYQNWDFWYENMPSGNPDQQVNPDCPANRATP
jgi:hypothetical protein